jgi:hypothetical protein
VSAGPEIGAIRLGSWQFGYGGLNFDVPKQPFTFADMTQLQTDYELSWGTCKGGSPRWSIAVLPPGTPVTDQTKKSARNIWVYFGSMPASGTNARPEADGSEVNTGNYIGTGGPADTPARYDSSQGGGSYGQTYTTTLAQSGQYEVVGISLNVDGGWAQSQSDFEQEAIVDRSRSTARRRSRRRARRTRTDRTKPREERGRDPAPPRGWCSLGVDARARRRLDRTGDLLPTDVPREGRYLIPLRAWRPTT